ncbi:MAG: phosphoribosylaminoimidazolesuccinocarboxamide synthase [Spirochaetia bacterium]
MKKQEVKHYLNKCFHGFYGEDRQGIVSGKVRDIIYRENELIITATDRISAFDRVLGTIPCKGEVLNRTALYWFERTSDIVENHILEPITPRTVRVKKSDVLPVEVVVRGYLTGSAWRDYSKGRPVSGITLPKGMQWNQGFETPLITPSTKAEQGKHDMPISCEEIVSTGLVEEGLWKQVARTAIHLFQRGTELAAANGLILVDTKYEFGTINGKLVLIDEIHTPDSSRFWYADTYQELFRAGKKQRKLDKEYLRQWLMDQGFQGDGDPPEIPDDVRIEVAWRYIQAYEAITGKKFRPKTGFPEAERKKVLSYL